MRVGVLHSLIRTEEKLLLAELTRHPEAQIVMLDDHRLVGVPKPGLRIAFKGTHIG